MKTLIVGIGALGGPIAARFQIVMDGPKAVKADFAPAQTLRASIDSGSVVGAGLSNPAVKALSPNGILSVFGSNFALSGR